MRGGWERDLLFLFSTHSHPPHLTMRSLALSPLASCNMNCLRQRVEKKLKSAIKALKKSINQERFLIRFAGMEYEVARKLSMALERQESCGPGQQRVGSKCGKKTAGLHQRGWQGPGAK